MATTKAPECYNCMHEDDNSTESPCNSCMISYTEAGKTLTRFTPKVPPEAPLTALGPDSLVKLPQDTPEGLRRRPNALLSQTTEGGELLRIVDEITHAFERFKKQMKRYEEGK